uniref:Cytidine deaminase n=1 Tax=Rhipicephalus zambeziensis TaxID=60191 RepID=A0A224YML3_9ACAR
MCRSLDVAMADQEAQKLVKIAQDMRARSYCNYSKVRVGAALLCEDGTIITGCNVENASYGLTICAERTALVKAVSEGHRNFKAIAIASNMNDLTMPCGACRQFIIEFGKSIVVYAAAADGRVLTKTADELLPFSFGASDLPPK